MRIDDRVRVYGLAMIVKSIILTLSKDIQQYFRFFLLAVLFCVFVLIYVFQ